MSGFIELKKEYVTTDKRSHNGISSAQIFVLGCLFLYWITYILECTCPAGWTCRNFYSFSGIFLWSIRVEEWNFYSLLKKCLHVYPLREISSIGLACWTSDSEAWVQFSAVIHYFQVCFAWCELCFWTLSFVVSIGQSVF